MEKKRQNALVTGSSSGIGQATAIALAKEGYNVGITKRHSEDGILVSQMWAHTGKIYYAKKSPKADPDM